ncbi:hypothetical protein PIB30_119149 [Stylosanthes scabra]|uniref:Uncharacterized protein n=1 Tax=Stylosanthes scabra TaxID=79078 RepID=A0ABU6R459_9FABA|nr:hypothetical protein [Stylosanthes scabra]
MQNPTIEHWKAVKCILRYLQSTINLGMTFTSCTNFRIIAFADADWASDLDDWRSTFGYCVYLGTNLISWKCAKQSKVGRSSTEAEYRAIATAQTEIMSIQLLLKELQITEKVSPTIYCDNLSSCHLSANPIMHGKSKHLETDLHFIRDLVMKKHLFVVHLSAQDQVADIMTKALSVKLFERFKSKLKLCDTLPNLEGGC